MDPKEQASRILYEASKITWKNRPELFETNQGFTSIRQIRIPDGATVSLNADGIGTKVEVAERMQKHDTIAYDLFAMVCDDAAMKGLEPIAVSTVLDVREILPEHMLFIKQLAKGYTNAANAANVAIINGETAILGDRIRGHGSFNYNWAAECLSINEATLITGKDITTDSYLIALREKGFRSNGLTLARKILTNKYGNNWHETELDGQNIGMLTLEPSTIYTRIFLELNATGIAHITGGGIPEKLKRTLQPSGLGADIQEPYEPPRIMQHCQDIGNITDREAYEAWNMGQGAIIISNKTDAVEVAKRHGIEAKVIGQVVNKKEIRIKNTKFEI